MSERSPAKASKSAGARGVRKTAPAPVAGSAGSGPEIEVLRRELEAARAEIAELQRRQAEAATRIDWLIDSLHNLGD